MIFQCLYILVYLLSCSPTEGCPGCLQVLVVMNKTSINIHMQALCGHSFPAHCGKYQGVQLLDHMVRACLFYKKLPNRLPKGLEHFALPPAMNESPRCSTLSQHLMLLVSQILAQNGLEYTNVVISHSCFHSPFSYDKRCGVCFHMCIYHLFIFFAYGVSWGLCPFLKSDCLFYC